MFSINISAAVPFIPLWCYLLILRIWGGGEAAEYNTRYEDFLMIQCARTDIRAISLQ